MSSNNQEEQYQTPFWERNFLGVPYWLIGLIILVLLIYWAYVEGFFASLGFNPHKGRGVNTVTIPQKYLEEPTFSPVNLRELQDVGYGANYYPTTNSQF